MSALHNLGFFGNNYKGIFYDINLIIIKPQIQEGACHKTVPQHVPNH